MFLDNYWWRKISHEFLIIVTSVHPLAMLFLSVRFDILVHPMINFCWNSYNSSLFVFVGTCAVVITKGGKCRSLVANLAAANCFTKSHIEISENKAIIEKSKIFYISVSCLSTYCHNNVINLLSTSYLSTCCSITIYISKYIWN